MASVKKQLLLEADVEIVDNMQSHELSLVQTLGREGSHIEHLLYKGSSMAVFTSGGDSSGLFLLNFLLYVKFSLIKIKVVLEF